MNKLALLSIVLMAGMVAASTTITTNFGAAGTTSYNEYSMIGGSNWQQVGDVSTGGWYISTPATMPTATISYVVTNTGMISFGKTLYTPGDWNLKETSVVTGTGATTLGKEVTWDTNTRSTLPNGLLAYPTDLYVAIGFSTPHFVDNEGFHTIANQPLGQTWYGFIKSISTNDAFNYGQCVSVNMGSCSPA